MKIPTSVRINGVDYKIDYVNGLNDGTRVAYGIADYANSEISLNPEVQEHQHMCVTLWHEILHIILDNAQIETEDDEYLIQTLATGIYQVISDNIDKFYNLVSEIPITND